MGEDDFEDSLPGAGISLLQDDNAMLGTAEIEIEGLGDGGEVTTDDSGIEEAIDEQYITESAMPVATLVGVLGGVILMFGVVILVCVAVKNRRRNRDEKKWVKPITIESVAMQRTSPAPTGFAGGQTGFADPRGRHGMSKLFMFF